MPNLEDNQTFLETIRGFIEDLGIEVQQNFPADNIPELTLKIDRNSITKIYCVRRLTKASCYQLAMKLPKHSEKEASDYWIVTNNSPGQMIELVPKWVHVFAWDDFKDEIMHWREGIKTSFTRSVDRSKTAKGRAVKTNISQILCLLSSIDLLIDDRIKGKKEERPNSDDAKLERDEMINFYKKLKSDLDGLRNAILQFKANPEKEKKAVKAVETFEGGLLSWWSKNHEGFINKATDIGLFGVCLATCSLAGAGGPAALAIAGGLVSGKPLVDALKSAGKKHSK